MPSDTSDVALRAPSLPQQGAAASARIPGEPGVWVLLFGDMALFGLFFVSYLLERAEDPDLFAQQSEQLGLAFGVVNALVLLTSSLSVVVGVHAHGRQDRRVAVSAFAGALLLGLAFVAIKVFEYAHITETGVGPSDNAFISWYFVLTGVHLVHLLIGLGVLALMISAAYRVAERPRTALVEGCGCFWHLVDLLWIVIFPLLYLVA